jgi:ubiquinone/menaquinone biosynthesis C-methylase UbiE
VNVAVRKQTKKEKIKILPNKKVPSDYAEMDLSKAKRFNRMVKTNFMPAIHSTVKQIVEDYGILKGMCVDVGCGTAVFAIELSKLSGLQIFALEKEKAIYEVALINIKKENLVDKVIPVLGDAHALPFDENFADFIISRGAYHCWENKVQVFKEIYRVLKEGGIGFVGGGFGRYVTDKELRRMKSLRAHSLHENKKAYNSVESLKEVIHRSSISNFRILPEKAGFWAEIKK